jgi:hypothetical protein
LFGELRRLASIGATNIHRTKKYSPAHEGSKNENKNLRKRKSFGSWLRIATNVR